MIVARPLRGAEGMGAATVGPGHRNTTYTGVRGPEAPKKKGRRLERDRERAQSPRPDAAHGIYGVRCTRC